MNKIDHIAISQFAIFKQLTSLKIIELNRVSIFFHKIFRINVGLNFDLKFLSGILSWAFKKIWRPNSEIWRAIFRIWPPKFFKGLTQNSTTKLKVEIQFYVYSENFMKKYRNLIEFYYF